MTRPRPEPLLWALALALAALAAASWLRLEPAPAAAGPAASPALHGPEGADPARLATAARAAAGGNPFRLNRRPGAARTGPATAAAGAADPAPAPRPALALTGLIGGDAFEAILEGVPGRRGSVLAREGDVFGELRVRRIDGGEVVIEGMDTTWILTVRDTRPGRP